MTNSSRGDVELLQVVAQLSFIQRAFELANLLLPSFGKLSILLGESSQFVPLCVELFAGSLAQPRVLQASNPGFRGSRGLSELLRNGEVGEQRGRISRAGARNAEYTRPDRFDAESSGRIYDCVVDK